MSQMSLKNKIMKKVMINLSHNELDSRRRSNLYDISGTTLCPCSFEYEKSKFILLQTGNSKYFCSS